MATALGERIHFSVSLILASFLGTVWAWEGCYLRELGLSNNLSSATSNSSTVAEFLTVSQNFNRGVWHVVQLLALKYCEGAIFC